MRLLDLYCCAGGAGAGYAKAGFDVVGVDINPQPNYPFEFHQADAVEFLIEHGGEFDAIHASPPCQDHTTLTKGNRGREGWVDDHVDLVDATRRGLVASGRPWVIENVVGSPLLDPTRLCGLMFDLKVFRHRLFESNIELDEPGHPTHKGHRVAGWRHGVKHDGDMFAVYGSGGGKGTVQEWQDAMGIYHTGSRRELAEAIPPAYTEFIGRQLLAHLKKDEAA